MPKISVIIPTYNSMTYLPKTVGSVLNQTFTDFELLIIDDGSSDDTATWAAQVQDSRVKLISQSNQGAAGARNTGIKQAKGQYIAFLDADDLWSPTKLEQQVQCLDKNLNLGLVHTWIAFIQSNDTPTGRIMTTHGKGNVWEKMVVYNLVRCGSTAMVRRCCFEEVGYFDQTLKYAEDWDMWIRISARYPFETINEPLVLYREHENNKSKNYEGQLDSFCKILNKAFQSASSEKDYLKGKAYGRAYLHAAWRALSISENKNRASELLRQALIFDPSLHFFGHCLNLKLRLAKSNYPFLNFPISLILSFRQSLPNINALIRLSQN